MVLGHRMLQLLKVSAMLLMVSVNVRDYWWKSSYSKQKAELRRKLNDVTIIMILLKENRFVRRNKRNGTLLNLSIWVCFHGFMNHALFPNNPSCQFKRHPFVVQVMLKDEWRQVVVQVAKNILFFYQDQVMLTGKQTVIIIS